MGGRLLSFVRLSSTNRFNRIGNVVSHCFEVGQHWHMTGMQDDRLGADSLGDTALGSGMDHPVLARDYAARRLGAPCGGDGFLLEVGAVYWPLRGGGEVGSHVLRDSVAIDCGDSVRKPSPDMRLYERVASMLRETDDAVARAVGGTAPVARTLRNRPRGDQGSPIPGASGWRATGRRRDDARMFLNGPFSGKTRCR